MLGILHIRKRRETIFINTVLILFLHKKLFFYTYYLACQMNSYGYNCVEKCSKHCFDPQRCDRVTGKCEGGCQVGWKGTTCDTG